MFFFTLSEKNRTTSNIRIGELLKMLQLTRNFSTRYQIFKNQIGNINHNSTKKTYWITCKNQNYFLSHGCPSPVTLTDFLSRRNGVPSEQKIQRTDSYCAVFLNKSFTKLKTWKTFFMNSVTFVWF